MNKININQQPLMEKEKENLGFSALITNDHIEQPTGQQEVLSSPPTINFRSTPSGSKIKNDISSPSFIIDESEDMNTPLKPYGNVMDSSLIKTQKKEIYQNEIIERVVEFEGDKKGTMAD